MRNIEQLRDSFDRSFRTLQDQIEDSFTMISEHPETEDEIIGLWKNHISQFMLNAMEYSEKHNNKDVFKAITKALIFGK